MLVTVSGLAQVPARPGRFQAPKGSRLSVLCLCHVRPEPEHGDQARVAEGGDPADARAGDGEHAALLIGPDGYIAWAAGPGTPDLATGLNQALRTWLSPGRDGAALQAR